VRTDRGGRAARSGVSFFATNGFLVLVGLLLVAATGYLWHSRRAGILAQVRATTDSRVRSYASEMEIRYNAILQALDRLASRGAPDDDGIDAWEEDASFYLETFEGIATIAWVDEGLTIGRIVPREGHGLFLGRAADAVLGDPWNVNVWLGSDHGAAFSGYVVGSISVPDLVSPIVREIGPDYGLRVSNEGETVFTSEHWSGPRESFTVRRAARLKDAAVLNLSLTPTEAYLRGSLQDARNTLFFGLGLSFAAVVAIAFAQNYNGIAMLSELRYQNLFEASKDAIFLIGGDEGFEDANPAALEMVGYSLDELQEMGLSDILPHRDGATRDDDPGTRTSAQRATGFVFRRKHGGTIPVELVLSPLGEVEDQQPVLGIARDVTARLQAEAARRESERRLVEAQRIARMGDFTWDVETGEVTWSEALFDLLGYEWTEVFDYAKVNEAIHHPDDLERVSQWLQDALSSGRTALPPYEYRVLRSDGRVLHVRTLGLIERRDDGGAKVFATLQDVTRLQEAKDEVSRTLQLLEFAMEQIPIPVIIARAPDVVISHFNQGALDLLVSQPERLTEIPLEAHREFWPTFYPDGTPYRVADLPLTRAIQKGHVTRDAEIIVRRDDGDRWISASAAPLRDEQGDIIAGIVAFPDITERKRAETELHAYRDHLETLVAERTAQLNVRVAEVERLNRAMGHTLDELNEANRDLAATARRLEAANRELDDFAYVVSHDLKAPLRGISQLAAWIGEDYAGVLDEAGQHKLALLGDRVKRMHGLIDGVLEYSRVGRSKERVHPVDLHPLVESVIDLVAPPPHVDVVVEGHLPTVVGEPTRLRQLFQNLVDNGIKFNDKVRGEVRVMCEDVGDHWLFAVRDNGPGIEKRHHERVFRLFQTLSADPDPESTGVGLALAKRIVEKGGGQMGLESAVGEGSTFTFTWPKMTHEGEHEDE